jgi:hypothetical protein
MPNSISEISYNTQYKLTILDAADIEFAGLPPNDSLDVDDNHWRFRIVCPGCGHESKARGSFLGQKVRCRICQHDFVAEWGEPVELAPESKLPDS